MSSMSWIGVPVPERDGERQTAEARGQAQEATRLATWSNQSFWRTAEVHALGHLCSAAPGVSDHFESGAHELQHLGEKP